MLRVAVSDEPRLLVPVSLTVTSGSPRTLIMNLVSGRSWMVLTPLDAVIEETSGDRPVIRLRQDQEAVLRVQPQNEG